MLKILLFSDISRLLGLFYLVISLCGVSLAADQQLANWNGDSKTLLDSGFSKMNIPISQFNLPENYLPKDSTRFSKISSGFKQPLGLFKPIGEFTSALSDSQSRVSKMADLMEPHIKNNFKYSQFEKELLSASQLKKMVQNTRSALEKFKLPENTKEELEKWLSKILASCLFVENWRGGFEIEDLKVLRGKSDSLLLDPPDLGELDVYELKKKEVESYEDAMSFFEIVNRWKHKSLADLAMYWELELPKLKLWLNGVESQNIWLDSIQEIKSPWGPIILGTAKKDYYNRNALAILDPGGDDVYQLPNLSKQEAYLFPFRLILDVRGNDVYGAGDYSLAGSFFGFSALWDGAGEDMYQAGQFSLSSSLWGSSLFVDETGNDVYNSKSNGQASAAFGISLFQDREGNDLYQCEGQCQGFGFTLGFALLEDYAGHDKYITSSPVQDVLRYDSHFVSFSQGAGLGYRPIASGGYGWLMDYAGNDIYVSDIFGQGVGYWYSQGVLYDGAGRDSYQAHQYAQGAGVHLAFGILWDKSGNDKYQSHGVGQGCGHDLAFGALLDEAGDDNYNAYGLSMGGGNANGLSLFVDTKGDDSYSLRTEYNSWGYSDWRRDMAMLGVFLDGEGTDIYGKVQESQQNKNSFKSSWGFFGDLDLEFEALKTPDAVQQQDFILATSPESLFIQASTAPEKFQLMVGPARKALVAKRKNVISFLKSKTGSVFPREQHALRDIVDSLYLLEKSAIDTWLRDSLKSGDRVSRLMSAELCGRVKSKSCQKGLLALLQDSNWTFRQAALWNLGKLQEPKLKKHFLKHIKDKNPVVQARAAFALGLLHSKISLGELKSLFSYSHYLVQTGFRQGVLKSEKKVSVSKFWKCWKKLKKGPRKNALAFLGLLKPSELLAQNISLQSLNLDSEEKAYLLAVLGEDKNWLPFLKSSPE